MKSQPKVEEIWKPVLDGYYEVSNLGRVCRLLPGLGTWVGRILSQHGRKGYRAVRTCCDRIEREYLVHVLVAAAFLGPCPEDKEVNHKDLDKTNNKWNNLEYKTHKQNIRHARKHGHWPVYYDGWNRGSFNPSTQVSEVEVAQIKKLYNTGNYTRKELGKKFDISSAVISNIVTGRNWRHVKAA